MRRFAAPLMNTALTIALISFVVPVTHAQLPHATLQDGTPIRLRLGRSLSSADARMGETVDFEVLEDVRIDDVVIVKRGSNATATITSAEAKRRMARGGKLDLTIDSVHMADGEKIALRGIQGGKGGSHTGAMTGAIVATSLVLWPAAPFFLLMHGKDFNIPKGTEITAYTTGDIPLDLSRFEGTPTVSRATEKVGLASSAVPEGQVRKSGTTGVAGSSAPAGSVGPTGVTALRVSMPAVATPSAATTSSVAVSAHAPEIAAAPVAGAPVWVCVATVTSSEPGADVEVDGHYVGSTPAELQVSPGEHTIYVRKRGFAPWSRTMKMNGGVPLNINADLDPVSSHASNTVRRR